MVENYWRNALVSKRNLSILSGDAENREVASASGLLLGTVHGSSNAGAELGFKKLLSYLEMPETCMKNTWMF